LRRRQIAGTEGSGRKMQPDPVSLRLDSDRSFDSVFEIDRIAGRALVPIAEVHAIVARAHLA